MNLLQWHVRSEMMEERAVEALALANTVRNCAVDADAIALEARFQRPAIQESTASVVRSRSMYHLPWLQKNLRGLGQGKGFAAVVVAEALHRMKVL